MFIVQDPNTFDKSESLPLTDYLWVISGVVFFE
jgi:hypothetical protein